MNNELHQYNINVLGMTCQGCANSINKAILKIDPHAKTEIHLQTGEVKVKTSQSIEEVQNCILDAGFSISPAS